MRLCINCCKAKEHGDPVVNLFGAGWWICKDCQAEGDKLADMLDNGDINITMLDAVDGVERAYKLKGRP